MQTKESGANSISVSQMRAIKQKKLCSLEGGAAEKYGVKAALHV